MKAQPPSPALLAAEAHLRAALADGPVPCAQLSTDVDRGTRVHARRRLGVQIIRIDGVPHYCLNEPGAR